METVNHGLGPIHDPRDIIKGPDREQLICSQLEIDIIQLPATMLRDVTLDIKIPIAVPGKTTRAFPTNRLVGIPQPPDQSVMIQRERIRPGRHAHRAFQPSAQLNRCLSLFHQAVAQAKQMPPARGVTRLTGNERDLFRVEQLPIIIINRKVHLAFTHVSGGRHIRPTALIMFPLLALEGQDIIIRPRIHHHTVEIDPQRIAHDGIQPVANRDLRARTGQVRLLEIIPTSGQEDQESQKGHPKRGKNTFHFIVSFHNHI